jgi:hypothetical protein
LVVKNFYIKADDVEIAKEIQKYLKDRKKGETFSGVAMEFMKRWYKSRKDDGQLDLWIVDPKAMLNGPNLNNTITPQTLDSLSQPERLILMNWLVARVQEMRVRIKSINAKPPQMRTADECELLSVWEKSGLGIR